MLAVSVACGSDPEEAERPPSTTEAATPEDPFRILMVVALSGPLASISEAQVRGVESAVELVNAEGGIGGRTVEVEVVDDGGDPTRAVGLLREAIEDERPDLVWPGTTSNETRAMLPVLTREGILGLAAAGGDDLTVEEFPTYFTLFAPHQAAAAAFVEHALDEGVEKLAVLHAEDSYGTAASTATVEAAEAAGIEVVRESFQPGDLDFSVPLGRLREANPDMLWVTAIGSTAPTVLNDRHRIGWDVPTVGDLTLAAQPLADLVEPEALEGVTLHAYRVQQFVDEADRSPALAQMLEALTAEGELASPLNLYANAYDMVWLVRAAAEQAGSTATEDLIAALEDLDPGDDPQWVMFADYGYASDNHFVAAAEADYAFIAPGPFTDGMIAAEG